MNHRLILALAAACAAFGAGARPARADELVISPLEAPVPKNSPRSARLAVAADPDRRLAARVREAYVAHRSAVAADAKVCVKDGVVTLSGQTVSEDFRSQATAYAYGVKGVKCVDNRMTVVGTQASLKSTALDAMNDDSITLRIKAALFLHCAPSAFATKVETRNGVVILRGRVRDRRERERIGRVVARLEGISAVVNLLTPAP
ncbi:MAG TPA: BON domain-containing protein [Elusimicrobiota bacterium]|nr:BON domain-containing protein [Elusimicrobiota bacterium]